MMKRLHYIMFLVIILTLALSPLAQAAEVRIGCGGEATVRGEGSLSGRTTVEAGNSAWATVMVEGFVSNEPGDPPSSFKYSRTDRERASDEFITARAEGKVDVSGNVRGEGEAYAFAVVEARGDEGVFDPEHEAWVIIFVHARVETGAHAWSGEGGKASAKATATGNAEAEGAYESPDGDISVLGAQAKGKTSSSASANGSEAENWSGIGGLATIGVYPETGALLFAADWADIYSNSSASGGKAKAQGDANGEASASFSHPEVFPLYVSDSEASGKVNSSADASKEAYASSHAEIGASNYMEFWYDEEGYYVGHAMEDFSGIGVFCATGGDEPGAKASTSASAKGEAWSGGSTPALSSLTEVSGKTDTKISHKGIGEATTMSSVQADQWDSVTIAGIKIANVSTGFRAETEATDGAKITTSATLSSANASASADPDGIWAKAEITGGAASASLKPKANSHKEKYSYRRAASNADGPDPWWTIPEDGDQKGWNLDEDPNFAFASVVREAGSQ